MQYDLSVIIPVFNESKTILKILFRLCSTISLQKRKIQFIVVDDGSTDDTVQQIQQSEFWKRENFTFLFHDRNKGKASAIRTAIPHLNSDYTIIQDGDLEYHPEDIAILLEQAKERNLRVLYGSRNLRRENKRGGFFFFWGGRFLTFLTNFLYHQKLTDMPTCYKLIDTDLLQSLPLRSRRFEFCPEVTALISKQGISIEEYPIEYSPRNKSEGKKINWRDGLTAMRVLFELRFIPTKRIFFLSVFFLFLFSLYLCTWNAHFVGYEKETADVASNFLNGDFTLRRAGFSAVLLYIPFVLVEKIFSFHSIAFLTLVPIFYSVLSSLFLYLIVEKITKRRKTALIFSTVISLASIMWPYAMMGMEYQMMLFITTLLYFLLSWQQNLERTFWLGFIFGIVCIGKSYGVLMGIPYLLFIFFTLKKQNKISLLSSPNFLMKIFFPAFCFFGAILLVNILKYDSFSGVYSLAHEFQIKNVWEGFYGVFFSIGKSIFLFNPMLILALFYWKRFYFEYKEISIFILSSFVILLFLTAPFIYWSDETWGVRKLVPILPLLHIPLIFYFAEIKKLAQKVIFAAFFGISVYVQLLGASYNYSAQLVFLRTVEMDSLTTMRYIPEFSHVVLYHHFFTSYLQKHLFATSGTLQYEDLSWFRWLKAGDHDIAFKTVDISLEAFEQPHIVWLIHSNFYKKIVLFGLVGTSFFSFLYLWRQCRIDCRENEDDV